MDVCILIRHGESAYNVGGLVNGNHEVEVGLSARGIAQARALAADLAQHRIDACVHTRFLRTLQTAQLMLPKSGSPRFVCEPLLDDIRCGEMEGWPVERDHAWRAERPRSARPPGGESVVDAAQRITRGLRAVAAVSVPVVAVVAHELVIRYALNGARGTGDIAGPWRAVPNARPFAVEHAALLRAAERIERAATSSWASAPPHNGG
jgi:broad specificity phosphatase PhoE